jgi:hypothetical protein
MRVVVGMATFAGREKALEKALDSLDSQVDAIHLYDNEVNKDLKDNGKFYGLLKEKEPCYYFTCDDDLVYPPDYVEKTIQAIEKHKAIITYHGRVLKGKNLPYYSGHEWYSCLGSVRAEKYIDVCGTGVSAFRTDMFNPKMLAHDIRQKMSDLIFSLRAAEERKKIVIMPHRARWINHSEIDHSKSIFTTMQGKQTRLIEVANKIYDLNHGN